MKTQFYHDSFEYQDEYDFETLGNTGITANSSRIVCPTCNGNGRHFRRDLDENLMVDSFREDCDEDGFNAYRNGAFDEVCTECNGNNVIDDVDWDTLPIWVKNCIEDWEDDIRIDEQVHRAECGYRY